MTVAESDFHRRVEPGRGFGRFHTRQIVGEQSSQEDGGQIMISPADEGRQTFTELKAALRNVRRARDPQGASTTG